MTRSTRQNPTPATEPTPRAEFITVTPDMAMDWLTRNDSNRVLRSYKVGDYVRDIAAERWTYSNDGICLAPDGRLINGQHRLTAIFEAGQSAVMLVIHDMPPEAMINMDAGVKRTAADMLSLTGEKNTHQLGAIIRLCSVIDDGRIYQDTRNQQITRQETRDYLEANPLIRHIAEYVGSVKAHVDCPPSAIGAAYWLIQQTNGTALAEYYIDQLATRENEPSGSAVLAVDSRMRIERRESRKWAAREYVRLLIRGWNYYAVDKRIGSIIMSSRGEFEIPSVAKWARGESQTAASA